MSGEMWKDVVGHYGYQVSNFGRVRSRRSINGRGPLKHGWRMLNPHDCKGYLRINIDGKKLCVHVLMAHAFLGYCPGMLVRHLDDIKTNNIIDNLAYGTDRDNADDSMRNGRNPTCENHGMAKLDWNKVKAIRNERKNGVSATVLSRRYGVTLQSIMAVIKYQTWKLRRIAG